jgi:hypothetical protein
MVMASIATAAMTRSSQKLTTNQKRSEFIPGAPRSGGLNGRIPAAEWKPSVCSWLSASQASLRNSILGDGLRLPICRTGSKRGHSADPGMARQQVRERDALKTAGLITILPLTRAESRLAANGNDRVGSEPCGRLTTRPHTLLLMLVAAEGFEPSRPRAGFGF